MLMNRCSRNCIPNLFHGGEKKKLEYVNKQRYFTEGIAKSVNKFII